MITSSKILPRILKDNITSNLLWDSGAIGRVFQDFVKADFDTLFKLAAWREIPLVSYDAKYIQEFNERAQEIGVAWILFSLCGSVFNCFTFEGVVNELKRNPSFLLPIFLSFPDYVMSLKDFWNEVRRYRYGIGKKIMEYYQELFKYIQRRLFNYGYHVRFYEIPQVLKNVIGYRFNMVPETEIQILDHDIINAIYDYVHSKVDSIIGALALHFYNKYTLITTDERLANALENLIIDGIKGKELVKTILL